MHDTALLRSYLENRAEDAFAEFVRRNLPLVYGAALRKVGGDTHLAEDVAQGVFVAAARDAARLARHPDLTGWLFTTTRFLAANAVRTEQRRRAREETARLDFMPEPPRLAAERLQPVLDEALLELRELDRQMVLLRFYRGLRLTEIATQLNSSENAVQKRIDRALERLQAVLSRRGITSTLAAVAVALEQQAAVTIPAGLAAASTSAGIAGGAASVGGTLAAPVLAAKLPLYAAVAIAAASCGGLWWYHQENARLKVAIAQAQSAPTTPPRVAVSALAAPTTSPSPAPRRSQPGPDSPPPPVAQMPATDPSPALPLVYSPPASASAQRTTEGMIPLKVEYPKPLFTGTPRPISLVNLEPPNSRPPQIMVPKSIQIVSRGKPVASSDRLPVIGELAFVTDGDKSGIDGAYLELGPGRQWVQIDLQSRTTIHAVAAWHFHSQARVYHDVIVQVSDDPEFQRGVTTLFNNDHDNSAKLGPGHDKAYVETHRGRIFAGRATTARYVRLYSNGNTSDELNHYCEIEVYGTTR